ELGHEDGDEAVEEGGLRVEAEDAPEAHGAAQDVADDVVPSAVAGLDAVGDGEADGAEMVADDAEGDVDELLFGEAVAASVLGHGGGVGLAAQFRQLREDGGENVGVVVRGEL